MEVDVDVDGLIVQILWGEWSGAFVIHGDKI